MDLEGRGEERIYEEEYIQSHSIILSGMIFRNRLGFFISLRWGSCYGELLGFIKMSTKTGPARSVAEETSATWCLPPQLSTASKPKSQLLPICDSVKCLLVQVFVTEGMLGAITVYGAGLKSRWTIWGRA